MEEATIVWTEYMRYRLSLRGYDLAKVEQILRYSSERYRDAVTGRVVVIGRHETLTVRGGGAHADARNDPCDKSTTNKLSDQIGEV